MKTLSRSCESMRGGPRHCLKLTVLGAVIGLGLCVSAQAHAATTVMRIDAGSTIDTTDAAGNVWSKDTYFIQGAGSINATSNPIANAQGKDRMYQSERWEANGYSIPLPNGTYTVKLHMAEINPASGRRVFNVSAEGQAWLSNYSIADKVGNYAAVVESRNVTVSDGKLDLGFKTVSNATSVAGIEIVKQDAPPPPPTQAYLRIDAGSPVDTADAAGNLWKKDAYFDAGTGSINATSMPIANAQGRDKMYQSERWQANGYKIPLPAGTYTVKLHMAEINPASGTRVFNVAAEGVSWLSNYNIAARVGNYTAAVESKKLAVTDGTLNLDFSTVSNAASVAGIEIFREGDAPPPPPPPPPSGNRPSGLLFDSGVFPMHQASVANAFEASRGKKIDVITVFPARENWSAMQGTWYMDSVRVPSGFNGTLDVGVPLWPNDGNLTTAKNGGYNGQWETFARNLAARYPTAYVRLGWEMNLPGWKHAAYPQTAEEWKQAYRHAVNSIRKGGPKLRIAWVVNEGRGQTGTEDARIFYPGDAYVDYIGMDAYDWWPGYTNAANIARHRDGAYGWNFWLDFAKSRGKKFVLPEWGVAPANSASGGDNPMYINFVYGWLKSNAQWIGYESYFSESASYIRSDLFTNNPKASAEYRRWMPLLVQ